MTQRALAKHLLAGVVLLLARVAEAASGGSVVSGVVQDARGVAQMGALVQVLSSDSSMVRTAFTDLHGRYSIGNLAAGRYLVRASATLLVPATRPNLQLRNGASAVVNLTLAALFDTASWLPAARRRTDEPEDDWKWTLRSAANRPILRIVDDGTRIEVATTEPEATRTEARAAFSAGDGGFGEGGVHRVLSIHHASEVGVGIAVRADSASMQAGLASVTSSEFAAGFERADRVGGSVRTVVRYSVHPEIVGSDGSAGLQVLQVKSAKRMSFGDQVAVEVGGGMEAVHTRQTAFATHPFLRVAVHPVGSWTLRYRMATDRALQGFDDLTTGREDVPVAMVREGKLALERGRHQEISVARTTGRRTIEVAYYHDASSGTVVSGCGASAISGAGANSGPGMLVDQTTTEFRMVGAGYKTNGARVTVSSPLGAGLWVAAEYSTGDALNAIGEERLTPSWASTSPKPRYSEAAGIAVKGKLAGSNTSVHASYRWQPTGDVTAVDPYSGLSDQAFLSFILRQPLHWRDRLPDGLDATIDVTNLLAQGYRPFVSADGQTLYFAQAPRTIQAGLSFSF